MSATSTPPATSTLAESRRYCEQLTRSAAKNFYYGLKLLPEPKRSAMFALYAYMRLIDDIADGEDGRNMAQRMEELDAWTQHTHDAIAGKSTDGHIVWPAFAEMAIGCQVPVHVFEEVIAGQRQDLHAPQFQNFEQLREYCYRVAGVVGLASIHVWGFEGGATTEALAVDRGLAFQLTNVLRDLREDAARGRTYLPLDELREAGITPEDLQKGNDTPGFVAFMHRQIDRAQKYYDQSAPLEKMISKDSRPTLVAMTQIYHGLLKKVKAQPQRVLHERVSLSPLSKLRIAWRAARSK